MPRRRNWNRRRRNSKGKWGDDIQYASGKKTRRTLARRRRARRQRGQDAQDTSGLKMRKMPTERKRGTYKRRLRGKDQRQNREESRMIFEIEQRPRERIGDNTEGKSRGSTK